MGMIGGLMNLCALFCRPFVGNLADRCSKYKVTFIGAVLMTAACLGYGIMCSVCQSTAILLAGEERRGLANSTYYIGLDLGMTLGPVIGGFLYGTLDLTWFYPVLLLTIPLNLFVYIFAKKRDSF